VRSGDFSNLALDYANNRPGYSDNVLNALIKYVKADQDAFRVADVGDGAGIWTKMLVDQGLDCFAVEPNAEMLEQGVTYTNKSSMQWQHGSAEDTGIDTSSINWVTMASSFHWVVVEEALREFARVLKPRGFLTVLWNPRDIEGNSLHEEIENLIYRMIPDLSRVSSGSNKHARDYHKELTCTGEFSDVIFFESKHEIIMTKERYLGVWRSVNDIQSQAGPEIFQQLLANIADIIQSMDQIVVPYKTRAWTAQKID